MGENSILSAVTVNTIIGVINVKMGESCNSFARTYLVNILDFNSINEVCSSFFKSDKLPGKTCLVVIGAAVGSLVEIDFVVAA